MYIHFKISILETKFQGNEHSSRQFRGQVSMSVAYIILHMAGRQYISDDKNNDV